MLAAALVALGSPACSGGLSKPPPGLEKIDHVIIIMQENRSFDSYFGTYPGAAGYPRSFVLQDHMFEPVNASSEPSHMYMVSAWSARCRSGSDPATCVTNLTMPDPESIRTQTSKAAFAWTDITWLLHRSGVSWAY